MSDISRRKRTRSHSHVEEPSTTLKKGKTLVDTDGDSSPNAYGSSGDAKDASSFSVLSNDILEHICSNFVSSSGKVDVSTLLSLSLASKRWKGVVYSQSLWKSATSDLPTNEMGESSSPTSKRSSIRASLMLQDVDSSNDCNSSPTMVGFIKKETLPPRTGEDPSEMSTFRAIERSSGQSCILSIPKNTSRTPDMLQELYQAHYALKNEFLSLQTQGANELCQRLHFPRGVGLCQGKLIRWYFDESATITSNRQLRSSAKTRHLDNDMADLLELEQGLQQHVADRSGHVISTGISPSIWATLVDWMVEIVECLDLSWGTAQQAMVYFNTFIQSQSSEKQIRPEYYQAAAGACFMIASKCRSWESVTSRDLSFCCDRKISSDQIETLEEVILTTLNCKLALPTISDFCLAFMETLSVKSSHTLYWTIRYFADLALRSSVSASFSSSKVASSVVVLSRFCLREVDLWPESLEDQSGYRMEELDNCILELSRLVNEINLTRPELLILERAYRKPERMEVSNLSFPRINSFDQLT